MSRRERGTRDVPNEAPSAVRLDVLLHHLCLAPSRTAAARLADEGDARVNNRPARASQTVRVGDRLLVIAGRRARTYEILALPARGVSHKSAPEYYRVLMDEGAAERTTSEGW